MTDYESEQILERGLQERAENTRNLSHILDNSVSRRKILRSIMFCLSSYNEHAGGLSCLKPASRIFNSHTCRRVNVDTGSSFYIHFRIWLAFRDILPVHAFLKILCDAEPLHYKLREAMLSARSQCEFKSLLQLIQHIYDVLNKRYFGLVQALDFLV